MRQATNQVQEQRHAEHAGYPPVVLRGKRNSHLSAGALFRAEVSVAEGGKSWSLFFAAKEALPGGPLASQLLYKMKVREDFFTPVIPVRSCRT